MIPSRAAYQVTSDTDPPRYAPGFWYIVAPTTAVASTAHGANSLKAMPWIVRSRVRIQALGVRVTTLAAGAIQLAIYRANATTLAPMGDVLANTGDIDVSVAQNVSGALVQGIVTIGPGLHWMMINANAGPLLQGLASGSTVPAVTHGGLTQVLVSANTTAALTVKTSVPGFTAYGTWPDASSKTAWNEVSSNATFLGQFQVAS